MLDKELILDKINTIKRAIDSECSNSNYCGALELISLAGRILYETNLYFRDDFLEDSLRRISGEIVRFPEQYVSSNDTVLFWDGFGLNCRGLIQIYLKALCRCRKVVYVTSASRRKKIPDILRILGQAGGKYYFIASNRKTSAVDELSRIVVRETPGHFFFYSTPDDVVATTLMYACQGQVIRYQINLTDHAFWLGAGCIDKCIEFRDYGANISFEYRGIDRNKAIYIPYYPSYDNKQVFEGYPFAFDSKKQKLFFSGGSLYKTLDGNRTYYKMVRRILSGCPEAVFWYAGTGDRTEMDRLATDFPGRACLTGERRDLIRIMEQCCFYLNTYPMVGGLMMQYAAIAGKVPLTLKYDDGSEGILVGQEDLNIEFQDMESLEKEALLLLSDGAYRERKSEQMKESVISSEEFEEEVRKLVDRESGGLSIRYRHIDTEAFRREYLERMCEEELYGAYARKSAAAFRCFPIEFIRGGYLQDKDEDREPYEVTVVICEYNTSWERLQMCAASCIGQKDIRLQVVVSDDGSAHNWFPELEAYFKEKGFGDYLLIPGQKNEGTVKNVLKGVQKGDGRYVKLISPGDCFYEADTLRKWVDQTDAAGAKWSFSDAVCYCASKRGNRKSASCKAHPQDIRPYLDGDAARCRWNYVVLRDIALGASILCDRTVCETYLKEIEGKALYGEDNIYRMMMHDGIVGMYYPADAIFYEYGAGISTSGDKDWEERLWKDWDAVNTLMKDRMRKRDMFCAEIDMAMDLSGNKLLRFFRMPRKKWYLEQRLYAKLHGRKMRIRILQ